MMAYVLTQAGARVAAVEGGGHNIDRDIRHHEWPWELPARDYYQPDPVQVHLTTKEEIIAKGIENQVTVFDGNAHNTNYQNHFFAKTRDWRYSHPEGKPYRWVRVRALGGKTNCWSAGTPRWGPVEWKPYNYDGTGIDWPISYEEMGPWYARTERLIGVCGEKAGKMTGMPDGEFQPAQAQDCVTSVMRGVIERSGYTVTREPRGISTRPHNGRPACHYCGRCGHACDTGAKFTSVGALLPVARATGRLSVFTNAIVSEVNIDSRGRASGVTFIDRYSMKPNAVRGRYVVVAASAIETARILLNSKSNLFPDGLANSSGQAGRHLVEDGRGFLAGYLPQLAGRERVNEDGYGGALMIHPFLNLDERTRQKDFMRRYVMLVGGGFSLAAGARAQAPPFLAQNKENIGH